MLGALDVPAGEVTLNHKGEAGDYDLLLNSGKKMTIYNGGVLTVGTDASFILSGADSAADSPLIGDLTKGTSADAPTLVDSNQTDNGLVYAGTPAAANKYFYGAGDTAGDAPAAGTTYTWSLTAGGAAAKPGWKAGA